MGWPVVAKNRPRPGAGVTVACTAAASGFVLERQIPTGLLLVKGRSLGSACKSLVGEEGVSVGPEGL